MIPTRENSDLAMEDNGGQRFSRGRTLYLAMEENREQKITTRDNPDLADGGEYRFLRDRTLT